MPNAESAESLIASRFRASAPANPSAGSLPIFPKALEAGAFGLLCCAVLAFGSVEPWSLALLELAAYMLAFALALRILWKGERTPVPGGLALLAVGCLIALGCLQSASPRPATTLFTDAPFSAAGWATQNEILKWAAYGCWAWVLAHVFATGAAGRRFGWWFFWLGALVSAVGLLQKASGNTALYGLREVGARFNVFGPYFNRNHAAGFLAMAFFVGAGLFAARFAEADRRKTLGGKVDFWSQQVLLALGLATVLAGLLRTGCLGALLASFLAAWGVALSAAFQGGRSAKAILSRVLLYLVLGGAAWSAIWYLGEPSRFEQMLSSRSVLYRWLMWQGTLDMIRDHPLWGVGLGAFRHVFALYQSPDIRGIVEHAHNDYLQLAAETGVLGSFLLLIPSVLIFLGLARHWGRLLNPSARQMAAGALAAILAFAFHSLVDFNLQIPGNALAVLGLVVWLQFLCQSSAPTLSLQGLGWIRWLAAPCLAALWALCSLGAAAPLLAQIYQRRATASDDASKAYYLERSLEWDRPDAARRLELARHYLHEATAHPAARTIFARKAAALLSEASWAAPADAAIAEAMGQALSLLGRPQDAGDFLDRARKLRPWALSARLAYGRWCLERMRDPALPDSERKRLVREAVSSFHHPEHSGRFATPYRELFTGLYAALSPAEAARALPADPKVLFDYGRFLEERGRTEAGRAFQQRAVRHLQALAGITPEDPEIRFWLGDLSFYFLRKKDVGLTHTARAVELAPENAYYRYFFARMLFWSGRLHEAELQAQAGLSLKPNSAGARELLRDIRSKVRK